MKNILLGAVAIGLASFAASNAHADPYLNGSFGLTIWQGTGNGQETDSSQQALPTNSIATGTSPIFSGSYSGDINLIDNGSGNGNLASYLASGGGTTSTPISSSYALSSAPFALTTVMEFSFTLSSAINFTIEHDDGISIYDSTNTTQYADSSSPTVEEPTSGSLAAGSYNLWYVEANGLPADLVFSVPEPISLSLFGAGLAGLGLIRRRRNRTAA